MENNQFEDSFKSAFAGAEVLPSDSVWTNIELDLEKESGGKLKRNILMFQLLAAASVAFAFGVTALYYLDQPVTQRDGFSKQALNKQDITPVPDTAKESAGQKINSEEPVKKIDKEKSDGSKANSFNNDIEKNLVADQSVKEQPVNSSVKYKVGRTDWSAYAKTKKPMLNLPKAEERIEPDAVMVLLARLKDEEKKYLDEEKKTTSNEKMWASVGVGTGSYKPNRQVLSEGNASSESITGESYSLALNVTGKISNRIIVQGGISYLTQNADFTSTSSNGSVASLSEYHRPTFQDSPGLSGLGPDSYQVNSSLQFVSIPVQVGYLVVDHAFGVQLNGGISTDLFISNTLTPESENYQKVTQAAGKDSPYRTVNFSGLVGTEISYRIADRYRISLNPGLRYSLNSIYKEGIAAEITPVTVDVSLRFRYIFK